MKGGKEEPQSNMLRVPASNPRNPRKTTILFETIPDDFKRLQGPIGVKPNAKGANPHLAEQEIVLRQNRASREFESCSLFLKQDSLPQRAFMVYYVRSYASRSQFQGESWVYKILRNFCHYQTFKSQLVKGFNRMSSTANFN